MLNQTTQSAIQALVFLALRDDETPVSPRQIASVLNLSPTSLSKVTRLLVKTNILRARKGALGGVFLPRQPKEITLLSIFEACQGTILENYCEEADDLKLVCGFHAAMAELHLTTLGVLAKWTLADLAGKPCPSACIADAVKCNMGEVAKLYAE